MSTIVSAELETDSHGGVFHDGAPTGNDLELANEQVVWLEDGASFPNRGKGAGHSKTNVAFEEWRQKLNSGDRMPRGRNFKDKVKQNYLFPFMQIIRAERKRDTFELLNIPFPESAPRGLPWKGKWA